MIGVFRYDYIGDEPFRRDAALDQPRRRRRLNHGLLAVAAVFGAAGDDNAQSSRDNVETLGLVLADHVHLLTAAGAERAFRFDDLLYARQVFRQRAAIGAALLRPLALETIVLLFLFCVSLGAGSLQLFQRQIELIFAQPFGFAAEPREGLS